MPNVFPAPWLAVAALALLLSAHGARAAIEAGPEEWAMIPSWCADAGGFEHPEQIGNEAHRVKVFALNAAGCDGHHHFCYGLIWSNRIFMAEHKRSKDNVHAVTRAEGDFEYMLKRSQPTCPMVYDAYIKLGEIKTIVSDFAGAEQAFTKALKNKPNRAGGYFGLSDLYETAGKPDKSIAILKQGIAANPRSSALKKKLERVQARLSGTAQAQ